MEPCSIVQDLLPLYLDGLTSPESSRLVAEHLEACESCREMLERMRQPVPAAVLRGQDGKALLLRHKRKAARRNGLIAALALTVGAGICLLILWSKGCFCIADRQTSPDGTVLTTAYSRNLSGLFPREDGFTIRDEGRYAGSTHYLNASFDGMWWSPDSQYLVISMETENGIYLEVCDYQRNAGRNLDNCLNRGIYGRKEFSGAALDEDGQAQIEYRFLQWSDYDSSMLVYYSYLDQEGIDRSGYFWYDYESEDVSGISPLQTGVFRGVVKEVGIRSDGTRFYVMDLLEPDGNGNTVELVFSISDSTALRGLSDIQPGNRVMVVSRDAAESQSHTAVSVTLLPE